jgi:hypothetical protein
MNVGLLRNERISNKEERLSKVNKLKDKIRAELVEIRKSEMNILSTFAMNKKAYKECILTLTALFAIEDFIDNPNVFMRASAVYSEDDIIIYTTHIYHINLMLDDKFNFCQRVLTHIHSLGEYYSLSDILYEKNLIRDIISVFDEMEYDSKRANN